ncbi:unnamed protein product, partial [Meganyctiphanes norvegica]
GSMFGTGIATTILLMAALTQWTEGNSFIPERIGGGRSVSSGGSGTVIQAVDPAAMMPQLVGLDVKCARAGMTVHIEFDRPFPGVIYSKGYFYDPKCNYVTPQNTGESKYSFNVPFDSCGTSGQLEMPTPDRDMYFDNTIIIQNDALIQEVWDTARAIRCTWQHTISKSVNSKPFKVYEPEKVSVQLDSRSVNTLMEIQQGSGPFATPATGYIYMGDDTSMVIYLSSGGKSLDANVVSCSGSRSNGEVVDLLDSRGCVLRSDLLTPFSKTTKTNGVKADLMLYSYLKGFKIAEKSEFVISCQLEVCQDTCSKPCTGAKFDDLILFRRRRRTAQNSLLPRFHQR